MVLASTTGSSARSNPRGNPDAAYKAFMDSLRYQDDLAARTPKDGSRAPARRCNPNWDWWKPNADLVGKGQRWLNRANGTLTQLAGSPVITAGFCDRAKR